jgi:hypothetical protein
MMRAQDESTGRHHRFFRPHTLLLLLLLFSFSCLCSFFSFLSAVVIFTDQRVRHRSEHPGECRILPPPCRVGAGGRAAEITSAPAAGNDYTGEGGRCGSAKTGETRANTRPKGVRHSKHSLQRRVEEGLSSRSHTLSALHPFVDSTRSLHFIHS